MDLNTLITVGVSVLTSAITAFAVVAYRMGRYAEKIEQLEKCDLNTRVSKLEGQYSVATITKRESPVFLNEKGQKLLDDSGAKKFVDDNLPALVEKIRTLGAETAYDVQENARDAVRSFRDEHTFVPLKDFAFKQGIDLELVELTARLYLRDKALPELGFTLEDVDASDPARKNNATHIQS